MKRRIFFIFFSLFILACMTVGGSTPTPVSTPTRLEVIIPHPNQTARPALPTRTVTPMPIRFTPEAFPAWVAEFSDPILKSLVGQYPVYRDDFPAICIVDAEFGTPFPTENVPKEPGPRDKPRAKVCSTPEVRPAFQENMWSLPVTARPTLDLQPDLQNGYTLLNTGWFFDAPDTDRNPHLALIDSGALILKLPEGKINKDLQVYNPHLMSKNFVLLFELAYMTVEPNDTVRIQFNQSADENFSLDISRNKTWAFHWGPNDNQQSISGTYERFTPERIGIVVIARDTQCAAYFNHDPLVYVENCRTAALVQSSKKAVSFHLLGEPGFTSVVAVDNVALWDLDRIP
jgi:hypothetical protein